MTIAYTGNQATNTGTSNSSSARTAAFGSNNAAGNMIVVFVATFGNANSVVTLTDSAGNTYLPIITEGPDSENGLYIFYCPNIAGGANTITATPNGAVWMTVCALEYSGVSQYYPLDGQTWQAVASSTTTSSGTVYFPTANDLVLGAFVQGSGSYTTTPNSGWTSRFNDTNNSGIPMTVLEQTGLSTSANPGLTYSSAAVSLAGAVAFRQAASVTSGVPPVAGNAFGVQRINDSTSALVITYPLTTTGNLITLVIASNAPGGSAITFAVTDSKSNTWTKAVDAANIEIQSEIWYCINPSVGASHAVTVTPSAECRLSLAINEYKTTLAINFGQTATGTGTSTTPSTSTVTTAHDGELYLCGLAVYDEGCGQIEIPSGTATVYTLPPVFTQANPTTGISFASFGDIASKAAGTYSASWTFAATAEAWAATIATFYAVQPAPGNAGGAPGGGGGGGGAAASGVSPQVGGAGANGQVILTWFGSMTGFKVRIPGTAGHGSAFTGTVTAVDIHGNTMTSYTGTVAFSTSDGGAVSLPDNYTFTGGDSGTRVFTNGFTLATAATQTITATDTTSSSISGNNTITIT